MEITDYVVTAMCDKCNYSTGTSSFGSNSNFTMLLSHAKIKRACPHCNAGKVTMSRASFTPIKEPQIDDEQIFIFDLKCAKCYENWVIKVSLIQSTNELPQKPSSVCPKCGEEHSIVYISIRKEK